MQLQLPLPTDFELITAEQLLIQHPKLKDAIGKAQVMVASWNDKRIKLGLKVWA